MPQYLRMAELVRNGRIGKLHTIHVGLPAGPGGPGNPTPVPVPPDLDWDLWLGPAPWAPYCPARVHFNFRWISDYSGGMLTDWGMHLLDTAQWGNDTRAHRADRSRGRWPVPCGRPVRYGASIRSHVQVRQRRDAGR